MSKDTFKLILFSIGFIVFVGMLFNGSFAPANVIPTQEFPTVTGDNKQDPNQPNYGDISDELKTVADKAIGVLLNTQGISVTPTQVKVIAVSEETFGNTALGCEQQGMAYPEVITPGFKVLLEADGVEYDYRLDQAEQILLCTNNS